MSASVAKPARMTVEEFLEWSRTLPDTENYELYDGVPVAMAGDSLQHNLTKGALFRALQDAVIGAGLPCAVFTDGVNVKINADNTRIPDCSVQCGPLGDLASMLIEPVILAEVTSPSSAKDDSGAKLVDYFTVPSNLHYMIVRPDQGVIVHHHRVADADIRTALVREGLLTLDPPGLSFDVAPVLAAVPSALSA